MFTDGWGRPVTRQRATYEFRKLCRAAGVARPDGCSFQLRELRHTCVSVLSHAGVDIEVNADVAGHVNSQVTRTVYRHAIADRITAAAQVMDTVYGAGAGSA